MQPKAPKQSTKTHRRSRTGCFTCRLRRKKCDEGKPACRACKHLGLSCEYKRPQWWGNVEQRKRQKETIKLMIKRTKLTEKAVHLSPANSADSPPELSRSLPTSDTLSDTIASRHRSDSIDSQYTIYGDDSGDHYHQMHSGHYNHHGHAHYQHHAGAPPPYNEYDVFSHQKQTYVNGYPVDSMPRRPSSTASFASSNLRRSSMASVHVPIEQPATYIQHPSISEVIASAEDTANSFFDFHPYAPVEAPAPIPLQIPVEGDDRFLLDHFLYDVQRLIFPVLDLHHDARQQVILQALANNECYRHCCLSISALHIKTTRPMAGADEERVDQDITRHRYKTISGLCEALAKDSEHLQILEATLGMILFQCSVGSPTDSLPDIPWHQHFLAAISLVNKLDLTNYLQPISRNTQLSPTLNMTLAAWIDILGATMLGRAPQFADTYREKHLGGGLSGLRELMGCDDRVMYLISEIACLEALKDQGMLNDMELCNHVQSLGAQIDLTEDTEHYSVYDHDGNINPTALTSQMTAAFRYAARIYLCSLVPGFDRNASQSLQLLDKLTTCLEQIPAGTDGFDRSLVWAYLIGGSVANGDSRFRAVLKDRCLKLGEEAKCGSFGRMERVLSEVWKIRDQGGDAHWRTIMGTQGWDCLLV